MLIANLAICILQLFVGYGKKIYMIFGVQVLYRYWLNGMHCCQQPANVSMIW